MIFFHLKYLICFWYSILHVVIYQLYIGWIQGKNRKRKSNRIVLYGFSNLVNIIYFELFSF